MDIITFRPFRSKLRINWLKAISQPPTPRRGVLWNWLHLHFKQFLSVNNNQNIYKCWNWMFIENKLWIQFLMKRKTNRIAQNIGICATASNNHPRKNWWINNISKWVYLPIELFPIVVLLYLTELSWGAIQFSQSIRLSEYVVVECKEWYLMKEIWIRNSNVIQSVGWSINI